MEKVIVDNYSDVYYVYQVFLVTSVPGVQRSQYKLLCGVDPGCAGCPLWGWSVSC